MSVAEAAIAPSSPQKLCTTRTPAARCCMMPCKQARSTRTERTRFSWSGSCTTQTLTCSRSRRALSSSPPPGVQPGCSLTYVMHSSRLFSRWVAQVNSRLWMMLYLYLRVNHISGRHIFAMVLFLVRLTESQLHFLVMKLNFEDKSFRAGVAPSAHWNKLDTISFRAGRQANESHLDFE